MRVFYHAFAQRKFALYHIYTRCFLFPYQCTAVFKIRLGFISHLFQEIGQCLEVILSVTDDDGISVIIGTLLQRAQSQNHIPSSSLIRLFARDAKVVRFLYYFQKKKKFTLSSKETHRCISSLCRNGNGLNVFQKRGDLTYLKLLRGRDDITPHLN